MRRMISILACAGALALAAGTAAAQQSKDEDPNMPKLYTQIGVSASVGGGVFGFTDSKMTDFTNVGGTWGARIVAGTRLPVSIEAAYSGGAAAIDAIGLDNNAILVSTGIEGEARVNFLTGDWQPYALAGIGWRRYDVTNTKVNTSDVQDSDNVLEVPMGAGIAWRYKGLVVDARGMFRAAFSNDLVAPQGQGNNKPDLHNWEAMINGGWEF